MSKFAIADTIAADIENVLTPTKMFTGRVNVLNSQVRQTGRQFVFQAILKKGLPPVEQDSLEKTINEVLDRHCLELESVAVFQPLSSAVKGNIVIRARGMRVDCVGCGKVHELGVCPEAPKITGSAYIEPIINETSVDADLIPK